jgi:hypothetical protein
VETLADRIARDGPVSELDAIGWAIRLAKRIETLHALVVSHGSVSPACVLTEGRDRNARAFLADVQHTKSSLLFQSPERVQGGDLSAADDVWALGVTLYALLTGQNPFAGANDVEVRQKILAASPAPLAVYDVGDDDLQHIIDRLFALELANRTASAVAFRRSLEEWHPDRGVAKLPPLEDEDDDDDDNARTMLVTDSSYMQKKAKLPSVAGAEPEEDARTVMRPMPQGGVAALFPRGAPAPAAKPPVGKDVKAETAKPMAPVVTKAEASKPPMQAPRPGNVPRPAVPRPLPKTSATGAPQGTLPKPGPVVMPTPAPALPKLIEEESSDDNVRTVMRDPEQMQALPSTPRNFPAPAAGPHGPLGAPASLKVEPPEMAEPPTLDDDDSAPAATLFLTADDNAPAPTMALAEAYGPGPQALREAPSKQVPLAGMDRPASLVAAHGTQQIPPGMVPLAPAQQMLGPHAAIAQPTMPLSSYLQEQAQIAMRSPPAQAPAPAPMMPQPSAQPVQSAGPGKGKLFLFAFVALVVAATVTFAILKLNGL